MAQTEDEELEPLSLKLSRVTAATTLRERVMIYGYITAVRDAWLQILIDRLDRNVDKLQTTQEVDSVIALLKCAESQSPSILMEASEVAAVKNPDVAVAKFVIDSMEAVCSDRRSRVPAR